MHPILFKLLVCFVLSFACSANVFADYPAAYVGKAELRDIAVSPDGTALVLLKTGHQDDIVQKFGWDEIMVEDSATGDTRLEIKQTYTYYSKSVNWLYDWVSWPFGLPRIRTSPACALEFNSNLSGWPMPRATRP